jgi:hypothetical protein
MSAEAGAAHCRHHAGVDNKPFTRHADQHMPARLTMHLHKYSGWLKRARQ